MSSKPDSTFASLPFPARFAVPLLAFGLAALLRLHNAWVAPPLSGFDGPYHAAYVGVIHWEGHFPLPDEGWSTHHPPLYYALCAGLWSLLPDATSPHGVLFALRLLGVAAALALGAAIWASARTLFPERPALGRAALVLTLFLPMLIGPSALLGNEVLASALCAGALALLLRQLAEPTPARIALAGLVAGLGVLTKLSALVVVATGTLVLLVRGLELQPRSLRALGLALVFGGSALCVSAPYFVRNLVHYGTPILTHLEVSADVMRLQGLGDPRPWQAYLDLHPGSLLRPGTFSPEALRAVWPVTFGSVWFDSFGSVLDVHHPTARRMARLLYGFGAVFSAAALLGALALATRRVRSRVPLAGLTLFTLTLLTLASYVAFTRAVATHSALKGTYLSPGLTAFVLFAALGLDGLARRGAWPRRGVCALLLGFALCVSVTFWQGGLAPLKVNPAGLYLRAYSDAATWRVYHYFIGPAPRAGSVEPRPR